MDAFQWWEELWNPIARPTADLGAEALRKYQAGEIDLATYEAADQENKRLLGGIAAAQAGYANYVEQHSLDPISGVVVPAIDFTKNLLALAVIVGTIYVLANWKRLEA